MKRIVRLQSQQQVLHHSAEAQGASTRPATGFSMRFVADAVQNGTIACRFSCGVRHGQLSCWHMTAPILRSNTVDTIVTTGGSSLQLK